VPPVVTARVASTAMSAIVLRTSPDSSTADSVTAFTRLHRQRSRQDHFVAVHIRRNGKTSDGRSADSDRPRLRRPQKIEGFRFGVNAGSVARAKSVAGLPERQGSHRTRRKLVLSPGAPAAKASRQVKTKAHNGPCAVLTSTPNGGITAIFFSAEQSAIYWRYWAQYLILLAWSCAAATYFC
jgi:hypothetical protein